MGGRYCAINSPRGPRWGQKSRDQRLRDFCPHLEPRGELIAQYRPPMSFCYITLTFDPTDDTDLGSSRSNFQVDVFQDWMVWLTWNKRDMNWDDVGSIRWPSSLIPAMTLTLDFEGQFSNRWCGFHYITLTFDPTHDLDLGFSRSNFQVDVFQEWMVRLTWHKRDMNW